MHAILLIDQAPLTLRGRRPVCQGFFKWAIRVILGGSWVVTSRVIIRVTILITHIRGLITRLITTPEPPSNSAIKVLRRLVGVYSGIYGFAGVRGFYIV